MVDPILSNNLPSLPGQTKIGVVIVNWNGCQVTQDTLADLRRIHLTGLEMQLYLVDNGSTDNSVAYFRGDPDIELIELDRNTGFSYGSNAGIRSALAAGCEYILLLNNDVYLTPEFLTLLVDWLASTPEAAIATPKIRYADPEQVIWYGGGLFRWPRLLGGMIGLDEIDRGHYDEPRIVDFATGCCMLVKRDVFKNIGLLDEDFPFYQEDVDFCIRAANAGFEIWYRPEALIWHRVSHSTANDQPRRTYLYAQSRFIFFKKHINGVRWVPVLGLELIRLIRTVGTALLRGQFRQAWSYTTGLFSGMRALFR